MTVYLIKGGQAWRLADDGESNDVVDWLIQERAELVSAPAAALSRQQVVTRLGRGIPTDFPPPDVVIGDPDQGPIRGWWETTVQAYLAGGAVVDQDEGTQGSDPDAEDRGGEHWERRSRQWDDVDLSAVDHRVLIATSHGIVTPAGFVVSRPLSQPADLAKLATKYQWSNRAEDPDPQVWITAEALEALEFPAAEATAETLPAIVEEFFGTSVKHHQSGYFTCLFAISDAAGQVERAIDVVLMPATGIDPSSARPDDRGVLGIAGTPTLLPDDEVEAAHLLGDRIEWLYGLEGAVPGPRWSRVGVHIAEATMKRVRVKPKNSAAAKLVPCPLPTEIAPRGKLASPWWNPDSWRRKQHRSRGAGVDVELDQQAAYLPSAEGLYLGYGTPQWVEPDATVFDQQRPPFGLFQLTVPAGDDLDLHRKLPIPHPGMSWSKEATFWATTADVQQLIAPIENGGAGLAVAELQIEAAWVWPEQHQWLKGFASLLRAKLVAARAAGRRDYEEMIKAIYTSYFGRLAGIGDGAFKYPYLHHQQPAWYAAIEGFTRWRALRYAVRIARDFDLYPTECLADAWFYRIPEGLQPSALEDPLRPDGTRTNGSYRLKSPEPA